MKKCVYCKRRYKKGTKWSFHRFPTDLTSRNKWLQNMKAFNWTPKEKDYLCSAHFDHKCFDKHYSKTTLKLGSVPTIFESSFEDQSSYELEIADCVTVSKGKEADVEEPQPAVLTYPYKYATSTSPTSKSSPASQRQPSKHHEVKRLQSENILEDKVHQKDASTTDELKRDRQDSTRNDHNYRASRAPMKLQIEHGLAHDHRYENSLRSSNEAVPTTKRSLTLSHAGDDGASRTPKKSKIEHGLAHDNRNENTPRSSNKAVQRTKRSLTLSNAGDDHSYGASQTPKKSKIEHCLVHDHRYENTPRSSKKALQRIKRSLKLSNARVKALTQRVKRLKIKVADLRTVINDLNNRNKVSDECIQLLKQYDDFQTELFNRMLKNTGNKSLSHDKYPPQLRAFAITLNFYSPKAYDYVRKKFNLALPHPRVIRYWYNTVNAEPGFSKEAFKNLKLKSEVCKQNGEKLVCALMLDEMSIKKGCQRGRDRVIRGHVDIGAALPQDDTSELPECKDALVFMVVPLKYKWKLPIAYFLINSLSAASKSHLIEEALIRLYDVGIEICSLTLDGPPEHFSAVSKLGADLQMNESSKPFFLHPTNKDHKVYVMFDPCHMLKNVRNCLGDIKILRDGDGNEIKWSYIESLAALQESEGVRLGNRLRSQNIDYKKSIMKVYIAAQTLSRSVADAIEFCDQILHLPEFKGSGPTVRFIRAIDKIFDFLNVRNPWGKGCKSPLKVSNENRWRQNIMGEIKYLSQIQLGNQLIGHSRRKTGFVGFYNAVLSVIYIYDKYVKSNDAPLRYLLTYKLCQDHLELFFSAIRSKGGWCPNPTASQFVNAYKQLMVHHEIKNYTGNVQENDISILTCASSGSQSKYSLDTFYDVNVYGEAEYSRIELKYFEHHENIQPSVFDQLQEFLNFGWAVQENVNETSKQCVGYIAGFVIRSIRDKIICTDCLSACESIPLDNISARRNGVALIMQKNRGGLTIPSQSVVSICLLVESLFRQACKNNNGKPPIEKSFPAILTAKTIKELLHKSKMLFPELQNHFLETIMVETFNSHFDVLIKQIITKYVDVRMFAATKNYSISVTGKNIRHFLTRQIIWARQ